MYQRNSSFVIHPSSSTPLIITKNHLNEIISHSREAIPHEACGLLGGKENRVEQVFRMKNADASEFSFCFDAGEQMSIMQEMDKSGLQMIAIYHSHPASSAFPSQIDIDRAFFPGTQELSYPDTAHLIVGLAGLEPDIRAFIITREGVREIKVIVEDSGA